MRSSRVAVAACLVACAGSPTPRAVDAAPALDAAGAIDAGARPADPSCVVADVVGTLAATPSASPFVASAGDPSALTNVELVACTPEGVVSGTFLDVSGSYLWRFSVPGLPSGETQLQFRSDPARTVRATLRGTVLPGVARDGGVPSDGGTSQACGPLAGSLIDGTFESGLSGMAPAPAWQVRDPATAATCPASTLSIVPSDPRCGGSALQIDAMGRWDCYAVQAFTDYGTITPGLTYRIHARVRAEAQDNPAAWFVVGLQWLDGSDVVFGDEKNPRPLDVNYDWTVLEWDLVAPASAHRAVVWLSAHYPGRVSYDDVSIARVP